MVTLSNNPPEIELLAILTAAIPPETRTITPERYEYVTNSFSSEYFLKLKPIKNMEIIVNGEIIPASMMCSVPPTVEAAPRGSWGKKYIDNPINAKKIDATLYFLLSSILESKYAPKPNINNEML